MLSSYRKEIKLMQPLKPGDAAAFQRLFNFLIKCQTMGVGSKHNPLDILRKDQQGKVIEEIRENSIQWPPRETIHQNVHKKGNKMNNERTHPVCSEKHDIEKLEDCKYYLQQTLEERSKLIFKKKLCYCCSPRNQKGPQCKEL